MMSKMRLGEAVVKLKPPSELSKMMNSMRLGDEENSTPQLDFQSSSSSDNDDDEDEDDLVCDETYCVPEGHSRSSEEESSSSGSEDESLHHHRDVVAAPKIALHPSPRPASPLIKYGSLVFPRSAQAWPVVQRSPSSLSPRPASPLVSLNSPFVQRSRSSLSPRPASPLVSLNSPFVQRSPSSLSPRPASPLVSLNSPFVQRSRSSLSPKPASPLVSLNSPEDSCPTQLAAQKSGGLQTSLDTTPDDVLSSDPGSDSEDEGLGCGGRGLGKGGDTRRKAASRRGGEDHRQACLRRPAPVIERPDFEPLLSKESASKYTDIDALIVKNARVESIAELCGGGPFNLAAYHPRVKVRYHCCALYFTRC
jgi:hypothetical protein